jgi:hypothetical protein
MPLEISEIGVRMAVREPGDAPAAKGRRGFTASGGCGGGDGGQSGASASAGE